jgi:hypothetical protein
MVTTLGMITASMMMVTAGCNVEPPPGDDANQTESVDGSVDGCLSHDDCGADWNCTFDDGVCGATVGTCIAIDSNKSDVISHPCTEAPVTVCGCDGQTYPTQCHAFDAGVSVASEGSCNPTAPPPPVEEEPPTEEEPTELCNGVVCGGGEYCQYQEGTCGGAGACLNRYAVCTSSQEALCGCDGATYMGRCDAQQAGANIAHLGGC